MYDQSQLDIKKIKDVISKIFNHQAFWLLVLVALISCSFGFLGGIVSLNYLSGENNFLEKLGINNPYLLKETARQNELKEYVAQTSQEKAVISVVKAVSSAVVSIVIIKEVPVYEQYYYNPFGQAFPNLQIPQYRQSGVEKQEVGGGTGVIVSEDGLILTNKHVVLDEKAQYKALLNDGKEFEAKVLARDPLQDLALIKIDQEKSLDVSGQLVLQKFTSAPLGDSNNIQTGQTVIAIGNALGEFRNTVSAGVISGLSRTITASGGGISETLDDIIQTDAAINKGNSGGPLLNLKGEVIGINTAIASEGQGIGFAIPINRAKRDISQVKETGKIVYPFLGIRYVLVTEKVKKDNKLDVDYGALIIKGDKGEPAIVAGSSAQKAGLKEKDVILEFNNQKITQDNPLTKILLDYNPGDKVVLKIQRQGQEKTIEVVLGTKE